MKSNFVFFCPPSTLLCFDLTMLEEYSLFETKWLLNLAHSAYSKLRKMKEEWKEGKKEKSFTKTGFYVWNSVSPMNVVFFPQRKYSQVFCREIHLVPNLKTSGNIWKSKDSPNFGLVSPLFLKGDPVTGGLNLIREKIKDRSWLLNLSHNILMFGGNRKERK